MYTEQVIIRRSEGAGWDDMGNPVETTQEIPVEDVYVELVDSLESDEEHRSPVDTAFKLFVLPDFAREFQTDDLVLVRGLETHVHGNPGASLKTNFFTGWTPRVPVLVEVREG